MKQIMVKLNLAEIDMIEKTPCYCFKKQFYYETESDLAEKLLDRISDIKVREEKRNEGRNGKD